MSSILDLQVLMIQQFISAEDNDMWSFNKLKKLLDGFVYVVVWYLNCHLRATP